MMQFFLYGMLSILVAVPMQHTLHMFQQNRYQMDRYQRWLLAAIIQKRKRILKLVLYFIPFLILAFSGQEQQLSFYLLLLSIYSYLFFKLEQQQTYIIPLKWTYRCKRLYAMQYVLFWLLIAAVYRVFGLSGLLFCTPLLFASSWFLLLIAGRLMQPIEEQIRNSYKNDAKKQLQMHKQLIKIGITGSYGKTSIKNFCFYVLNTTYDTLMTPHSYNNKMGLTLTIRNLLTPVHQIFLAEMGADHPKEINELAEFITPQIGIVSAIGTQHIETFGSQEIIIKEKMQLIEHLPIDGLGILNWDQPNIRSYAIQNKVAIMRYGIDQSDVEVRAINIHYGKEGTTFTIVYQGTQIPVSTKLLGKHNVYNLLAAFCVGVHLQVKETDLIYAIRNIPYVEHRLQIRQGKAYTILDDAYNANTEGALYALQVLEQMPQNRWIVTPGFLDLGSEKKQAHQTLAEQMVTRCDRIVLIGEKQTKDIYDTLLTLHYPKEHLFVLPTMLEAWKLLDEQADVQDVVLLENDLPDAFNQ